MFDGAYFAARRKRTIVIPSSISDFSDQETIDRLEVCRQVCLKF